MLDMSLGSGIALGAALGSLFLGAATVLIVWINNIYTSRQDCSLEDPPQSQGQSQSESNSYIRRGEYNQSMASIDKRLSDMHEESKGWWKQLNGKVDELTGEFRKFTDEQRVQNNEFRDRISQLETTQQMCPARKAVEAKTKESG